MNLLNIWVYLWLALGAIVAVLALYRKFISSREDDIVHVSGESAAVTRQVSMAQKLEKIDHWGKILTIVLAGYGLILGAWILYALWQQSAVPAS